ncbi:right-handed parallel beta-helix repeat-containing protein [Agrilutibacter solisilvae]|uniref:Right-handed parallel beta-helix repeat-containing protein n=1 Tax=Agrilutibacter solisilvae TaxID=2763317 RepID=A0A975AS15_9GAMM|nr:right-handed parallel beta-helix repeat-containing protein [Lysobacter solisilvae]QSX77515.1 right-handed parallel beta-helix repeat-containing protein [Lysobacter solisilvae]
MGNAITIANNNVTIDCNDFKVGGLQAGAGTQTNGIYAMNRPNITVRNCNVRGFYRGINLEGSSGHVVEDNRLEGNTFLGASVRAYGSVVRRNQMLNTGGTTNNPAERALSTRYGVDVLDNLIDGVFSRVGSNKPVYGIEIGSSPSVTVAGNRVRNLKPDGTGTGSVNGIFINSSLRAAIIDNHVTHTETKGIGIKCISSGARVKDNVVGGFESQLAGCNDSGGNDLFPY